MTYLYQVGIGFAIPAMLDYPKPRACLFCAGAKEMVLLTGQTPAHGGEVIPEPEGLLHRAEVS